MVLLAEDDPAIADPLSRALHREGYAVHVVGDGPAALDAATAGGVDLLVLDLGLPGMDGLEVCRRLRKQEATANIPIVLLTFRVGEESVSEGYASGCTAYLKKPIATDELVSALRQHLGD